MKSILTLVIPCYNKVNFVRETLNSVVKTHDININKFECILVDEESNDGTTNILIEYAKKYTWFRYVRILNDGVNRPSNARNFGIKLASSKYIMFLDADDLLCENTFIDDAIKYLEENQDTNIYIGSDKVELEKGSSFDNYLIFNLYYEPYNRYKCFGPPLSCCIFRTEIAKNFEFENTPNEDVIYTYKQIYLLRNKYYFDVYNFAYVYCYCNCEMIKQDVEPEKENTLWEYDIIKNVQHYKEYEYCLSYKEKYKVIEKAIKPIVNIDYHVIDKCNLNCAYCNHFAPLIKNDNCKSLIKVKEDLTRLSMFRDYFVRLTLLGGEPTLNPNLTEILDLARTLFPYNEIMLITNGTTYKTFEKYREQIHKNHILVHLSVYDLKNSEKIIETFKNIVSPELLTVDTFPIDNGFCHKLLAKDQTNVPDEKILACQKRVGCLQLIDNKLYICHYAGYLNILKEYFKDENIHISNDDAYIELLEETKYNEIINFTRNKIPNICHYCRDIEQLADDGFKYLDTKPWRTTEYKLEEFCN